MTKILQDLFIVRIYLNAYLSMYCPKIRLLVPERLPLLGKGWS